MKKITLTQARKAVDAAYAVYVEAADACGYKAVEAYAAYQEAEKNLDAIETSAVNKNSP